MVTETFVSVVPPEISDTLGKLPAEIEKLQGELAQALHVWQSTLAAEKNQFEELVRHKELAWQEQENQWAAQSRAFEERLQALSSDFESRLKQTEQNAARSLSELDDAWQRDKLAWGPAAPGEWIAQKGALEEKVRLLEESLVQEKRRQSQEQEESAACVATLEQQVKEAASGPTSATVAALQGQLSEFQRTVASFQDRAAQSDELVSACVQALDYQISVLYDLVHHYARESPGQPKASDLVQP